MLTVLGGLAVRARAGVAGRTAGAGAGGRARTGAVPGPGRSGLAAVARSPWHGPRGVGQERRARRGARGRVLARGAGGLGPPPYPTADRASVGSWDATSAAIVTAILIGDRAGLDDRVERDLQEAGTYHVIAISGGNIAILAGCLLVACRLLLVPWRAGLALTIILLLAYAELAGGGSSVDRATTMAVVYLGAMLIDQRTSAASALAVAASLILAANPLALVDPAFLLTFGATIAIVVGVPAITAAAGGPRLLRPAVALIAASAATEVALLPLGPLFFSRVTVAGLLFNFAAVPLMSIVQIGGMAAVAATAVFPSLAHAAGWVPHAAARATGVVGGARARGAVAHVARAVAAACGSSRSTTSASSRSCPCAPGCGGRSRGTAPRVRRSVS